MASGESLVPAHLLSVLEQTPIIIEKILMDAPPGALEWKPATDRWSVAEVLGHLADVEIVVRERLRRMVEEESPAIAAYDQNAAYAAGKYAGLGKDQLHKFCHERDRTLSWLRYQPAGAARRTATHSELGSITVAQLLNEWAFHDLGHIRQIAELYRSKIFYPQMGGFQRYYTVKP